MIEANEFFTCVCDNCGAPYGNDDFNYLVMPDKVSMEGQLGDDDEWYTLKEKGQPDKHYCPDCFRFGENDTLVIIPKPKDVFDTGARLPEQKEESQETLWKIVRNMILMGHPVWQNSQ